MNRMEFSKNRWIRYPNNPVLTLGSEGSFDSFNIMSPMVVKDKGLYKMWYSGGPNREYTKYQIGYATSKDGLNWVKYPKNPVIKAGERDNFLTTPTILRTAEGYLLREESLFKMYFTGNRENDLEYATSSDGVRWKKYSENPVLKGIYAPTVIRDGEFYKMWYTMGSYPNFKIGYATSRDGIHWEKYSHNPVMKATEIWEGEGNLYPFVIKKGKEFFMWYTTLGEEVTKIALAKSSDGVHWVKPNQPILEPEAKSRWDSVYTSCPCVIKDISTYRLYYAGRKDMVHKYYAIGLAEISIPYTNPHEQESQ